MNQGRQRPVVTKAELNLLGKDYLTVDEAAHYCCVSVSQFREHAKHYGLLPIRFMGRVIYRKNDLQGAIETEWQHYGGLASSYAGGVGI